MPEKLFYIQLDDGAWLKDPIAGCSLAAQGLWLRMMFLMKNSSPYGYLAIKGSPIDPAVIARRTGCDSLNQYESLLAELDGVGVPSRTSEGIIFSRRMVRDQKKRDEWRHQKQNQRHQNGKSNAVMKSVREMSATLSADCPSVLTLSSSSSSKKTKTIVPLAFDAEDEWLKKFLLSTRLIEFRDGEREALMDPKWWELLSVACESIDLRFLESEFAKIGMWLKTNRHRRPTKRFISNWLEKASSRRKEYGG